MAERTIRSLGVASPGRPAFFRLTAPPPGDGQFWVETWHSGLSAGTELSLVKGTNPFLRTRWDRDLRVFCDGKPTTRYPIPSMGYMEVGRVAESRTGCVAEGDIVAMAYGHRTGHLCDPSRDVVVPVPPDVDPLLGVYCAQMGPICANGLLHAAAELVGTEVRTLADGVTGRRVLVTGAGVVGLLTGLFARHHGAADVAVADPTPERLAAARGLGLEALDEGRQEAWRWCKQRWRHGPGDCGADVVFQCRGRAAALHTALRALRPQGTVVDLAFYQDGAPELRLGEEFHHNHLAIRCAQIGRVPRGLAGAWDRTRLADETIALLRAHGRLLRTHVVSDVVPFTEAASFVADLATRRRHAIQAVFDLSDRGAGDGFVTNGP